MVSFTCESCKQLALLVIYTHTCTSVLGLFVRDDFSSEFCYKFFKKLLHTLLGTLKKEV